MFELTPIMFAGWTGFISGILLSIPVGPINLTIMHEGARRGFKCALAISLGAILMEVIYCTIAFTGFSQFFGIRIVKTSMEVFSFVFMLFLGFKFLLAKTVTSPTHISKRTDKLETRIEEKFHPHSAFMIGFVRTMANPGVLLFWIILAANFMARDWVDQDSWESKAVCIVGVALGVGFWFVGLSWAVSLGHKKFSEKTLLRMEHFSGIGLLLLAVIHGGHIAWQLAKHKM